MIDNTSFFLLSVPSLEAIRSALAEVCGVDAASIIFASAIGYEWEEPTFYDGKTLVQWHEYTNGDAHWELEVLLGGERLPEARPAFFEALASALGTPVLEPIDDGRAKLHTADALPAEVDVELPEAYGPDGPRFNTHK